MVNVTTCKCNPIVTTQKIALEYTQKEMRKEFSFTAKTQLNKNKTGRQKMRSKNSIRHIENK